MVEERRNDIGYKTTITVFAGVVAVLIGLFIHAAWSTASVGYDKAARNEVKIASIEQSIINIGENIKDIKDILKKNLKN
jgi:hypothetical protein